MASVNKVFLLGNLTKDPEIKFLQSGSAVANIRLAVNRKYKGADGLLKDEVAFLTVEAWGKTAETSAEYLKKGAPVHVEGRLKVNEWEKDGQKRSQVIIVAERVTFLPSGRSGAAADAGDPGQDPGQPAASDDDIPF